MQPYKISSKEDFYPTYKKIAKLIKKYKDSTKLSVIDIGCGGGEIMNLLNNMGISVFGIDPDKKCIELSSKYGKCKQGQISDLGRFYKKNQFDVAIVSHVLEHLENPKAAINKIKYISKKRIIIAIPNLCSLSSFINSILSRTNSDTFHIYGWNYSHLNNFLVEHCDLKIISFHGDYVRLNPIPIRLRRSIPFLLPISKIIRYLELFFGKLFPGLSENFIVITKIK